MTKKSDEEKKIIDIIEQLRPFLINDGGDVKFIKYEDGIVYLNMLGACSNCSIMDYTLKDGIEAALKEEIPSIKGVINVPDDYE